MTIHGEVVSHVNISRVEVEDGGLYTCIVENRAGTARHEGRLNIYGKFFGQGLNISRDFVDKKSLNVRCHEQSTDC